MEHKTGIYPFWMWNGRMECAELSRQIKLAKMGGVTGLTLHARAGNEIPYLSDRWMELVRFSCEEAEKAGLEIWLYDEQGFPSGDAGGKIPALGEKFQQKALLFSEVSAARARQLPDVVRVFSKEDPAKRLVLEEVPDGETVIVFRRLLFPRSPDMLGKDTAEEFLKITHDRYYAVLKDFFDRKVITGIFTDDSHYLFSAGPLLAYMDDLEETFRAAYGYGILDNLSALVENIPGAEKIRSDYYRHMAETFNARFMKPMHAWCASHGVPLYGHLSGDEGPLHKIISRFGDPGSYLKHFQTPGLDDYLLMNFDCAQMVSPVNSLPSGGRLNRAKGFPVIVCAKQASSAAAQTGDGRCMAEVLASAGWGVPLEMAMNHLRFLNILGANVFVTHDFAYTSAKVAKRDHPASYFFQQPYFRRNREIFSSVLESLKWSVRGRSYAETLVIHPVRSAQCAVDGSTLDEPGHYRCKEPSRHPDCREVTEMLSCLCLQLMRRHISFDFGFETALDDSGVEAGCFRIGKSSYKTVILPGLVSISGRLASLLRDFVRSGGQLISTVRRPVMIDGETPAAGELPESLLIPAVDEKTVFPMAPDLKFTVSGGDGRRVATARRIVDGKFEYMLHNCSNDGDCQISVDLPGYLCVDPVSRAVFPVPERFNLEKYGIVHLIPETAAAPAGKMPSVFSLRQPEIVPWPSPWRVRAEEKNVYRWESAEPTWSRPADFRGAEYDFVPEYVPFTNRFELAFQPESLKIALETVLFDSVKVNGVEILGRPRTVHDASPDLFCIEIADLVHPGENIYAFTRKEKHPEFIYLLGDFSVDDSTGVPKLLPPREITFGDLASQGMPFYRGTVTYFSTIDGGLLRRAETCRLEIPAPLNGAVGVRINGVDLPMRPCAPWRYDIGEYVEEGRNEVELIYYSTAQNFLGPRQVARQKEHFSAWYPPRQGETYDMPLGLPAPPVIAL